MKILWVSLLVLIISSCSLFKGTSKRSDKKQPRKEVAKINNGNTVNAERKTAPQKNQPKKLARKIAQEERTTAKDQLELERIWAKKQVFTEREKVVVGFCLLNFFANSETVEMDLNNISSVATFPFYGVFTSNYGFRGTRMHQGVDLSARNGAKEIYAYLGGVVRISTFVTGFGNTVVLRHFNGLETVYAHNRRNLVKRGDIVSSGDVIAIVGHTGRATGAHLHFEIRVNGIPIDPNYFIDPKNKKLKRGKVYLHRFSNSTILASKTENRDKVIVKRYHTISRGDTLSHLSRKYGISILSLCNLNGISVKSILKIGQQLRVA